MFKAKWVVMLAVVATIALMFGCGGSSGDGYEGTWTGKVCGRGLTLTIDQNGSTMTGGVTFTNPDFSGTFRGTQSGNTAVLIFEGHTDWRFDIVFQNDNYLTGSFFKVGEKVCDISASK